MLHPPPLNVSVFWDKLSKLVLFLLVIASLLFASLKYLPLIRTNQNYRKELLSFESFDERLLVIVVDRDDTGAFRDLVGAVLASDRCDCVTREWRLVSMMSRIYRAT